MNRWLVYCVMILVSMILSVPVAASPQVEIIVDVNPQHYEGEVAVVIAQTFYEGETSPVDGISGMVIRPDGVEDVLALETIESGLGNLYMASYLIPHLEGDYLVLVTASLGGIEGYGIRTFRAIEVFGPAHGIVQDIQHMHMDIHGIKDALSTISTSLWIIAVLLAVTISMLVLIWRRKTAVQQ